MPLPDFIISAMSEAEEWTLDLIAVDRGIRAQSFYKKTMGSITNVTSEMGGLIFVSIVMVLGTADRLFSKKVMVSTTNATSEMGGLMFVSIVMAHGILGESSFKNKRDQV